MPEMNGMAHVMLTVSRFDEAQRFYGSLLPSFGMQRVHEGKDFVYWVGARTALGIQRCADEHAGERFVQLRVGLHHLCFRAKNRADVDATAEVLRDMGATIVRGPMDGAWAPGYYYVLFEDPDGIRVEVCHVPGHGVLADDVAFNPSVDY